MGAWRFGSLFLCLIWVLNSRVQATDYFFTQSAYFHQEGRVTLFIDFNQYLKKNTFGVNQYLLQELPLKIKATIIRNVQASIAIPLLFGQSFTTSEELPLAIGNLAFEIRFGNDDDEYDYRQAYFLKYRIATGPSSQKITSLSQLTGDNYNIDYYPLSSQFEEITLGWHATKNITPKTQFHFNVDYTYQLSTNETITNFFQFGSITNDNIETNARGQRLAETRYSLFGIDTMLQRLFWTTSYNDPWSDKRNDHLNLSVAIDTYINTDYYFGKKKVLLGLKPFLEVTWLVPFSSESFYNTRLLVIPGLFLKFTKQFRYLFGIGLLSNSIGSFDFENSAFMSLRIVF